MDTFTMMVWLIGTFLLAGMVKGVTGMGLPTVAMGLVGVVMSPVAAAALLVVPSFVTNVWQLLAGPACLPLLRRLWPMMLTIVAGTVLGAALLVQVDARWSSLALGLALIVYAVYALFVPTLAVPERAQRWLGPLVGAVTGVVTGATGVFVMPAVPYLQSLRLEKEVLVQALGLSFTVSTVALAVGLAVHGAFQVDQLGSSLLLVVPALIGMALGQRLRQRISQAHFRIGFLVFLILLGGELASRPFF